MFESFAWQFTFADASQGTNNSIAYPTLGLRSGREHFRPGTHLQGIVKLLCSCVEGQNHDA